MSHLITTFAYLNSEGVFNVYFHRFFLILMINLFKKISLFAFIAASMAAPLSAKNDVVSHSFEVGKGTFMMDGKPFVIKAAEVHYPRIPRPYWEHRIKMCKALGMNTLCLYVFWNIHEQQEGKFDFSGQNDVAEFCRLAQKNGMFVIVRPGPYVCAEWEMGGLPWWLLKKKDIKLREQDPYFLERVRIFEKKVGEQLAPLTVENGGPIIMVQVENEYGSYGKNKPYVSAVRDILRESGFDKVQLFQCDWSSNFTDNALDDLLWTMNFGTNANVLKQFEKVKKMRPDAPLMCSEYWSGWFDGWGSAHQTRPADAMVNGIKTMLDNNISFSLYMTHGGTSFAHWAGANNKGYAPDCTSYDYDAPINEQGAPTDKYFHLRELLQKYSETKLPAVPKAIPVISFPEIEFREMAPFLSVGNMPETIESRDIKPMEQFDMGYGSIMYTTTMPELKAGALLQINDLHDYAIVIIDGEIIGRLYRGSKYENTLRLKKDVRSGAELSIFVEAMGRINYSKLINDPKGITNSVCAITTDGKNDVTYNLKDWKINLFPVTGAPYENKSYISVLEGYKFPAYYRASLKLKAVGDTYLDMSTWGKGLVWINGHCIGRFWEVGPQQTLYVPGCWLKKGANDIVVLDIAGPRKASAKGVSKPVVDELHREFLPKDGFVTKGTSVSAVDMKSFVGNDAAPGAK